MGSNHPSVPEGVMPWTRKSRAHAMINTTEDQSPPPDCKSSEKVAHKSSELQELKRIIQHLPEKRYDDERKGNSKCI